MVKQRLNRLVSLLVAILLVGAAACTESNTGQIATPETTAPPQVTIISNDQEITAVPTQVVAELPTSENEPLLASPTVVAVPQNTPTMAPTPTAVPDATSLAATAVVPPATATPTTTSCANVTEIPQSECEALIVLVPEYLQQPVNAPCSWGGVTCANQHVTDFYWSILDGNASTEISRLTNLTSLYIVGNYDLYSLPPEIGDLANLTTLFINHFTNLSSLPRKLAI